MVNDDIGLLPMLGRSVRLRCPRCGARRNFLNGWFRRHERCRTCGIRWCREEGFELGALALNTFLTFGALGLAMSVGFVATSPDIPVLPFVLGLAVIAVLLPILLYPFTYVAWLAVDLQVHPVDAAEAQGAARVVAQVAAHVVVPAAGEQPTAPGSGT